MSPTYNHILRIALSFSFLYPPISAFINPYAWIGYMPPIILDGALYFGIPATTLLHIFGGIEISIALWILSGWRMRIPLCGAIILLTGIILCNLSQMDILFRDIPIILIAVVLLHYEYIMNKQ